MCVCLQALYMYIYTYICIFACVYVNKYIYIYIYIYIHAICSHACTHEKMYVCVRVCSPEDAEAMLPVAHKVAVVRVTPTTNPAKRCQFSHVSQQTPRFVVYCDFGNMSRWYSEAIVRIVTIVGRNSWAGSDCTHACGYDNSDNCFNAAQHPKPFAFCAHAKVRANCVYCATYFYHVFRLSESKRRYLSQNGGI